MDKAQIAGITIVVLSFLASIYLYPSLPDKIASHWGFDGKVDGYTDKQTGAFMLPALSLAIFALLHFLPKLDPLKKNYASFKNEYSGMAAMFAGFLLYIQLLMLAFSLGYQIDMGRFLAPAFGALFYYMGILLSKAKQNWFVGIRTPWTLSSQKVWDKTHKICSKLFKAAGIIAILGAILPEFLIASSALLIAIAIFSIVYSYVEFSKEKKGKKFI
jgi:uncharacterized membrane protein